MEREKKTSQPRAVGAKPLVANKGQEEVCAGWEASLTPAHKHCLSGLASGHLLVVLCRRRSLRPILLRLPPSTVPIQLPQPGAEFSLLCLPSKLEPADPATGEMRARQQGRLVNPSQPGRPRPPWPGYSVHGASSLCLQPAHRGQDFSPEPGSFPRSWRGRGRAGGGDVGGGQ